MSFFSEEQQFEMRELFFETASELLQALNEQGLRLEQTPQNAELVREVRRTVHTLKGDSAASDPRHIAVSIYRAIKRVLAEAAWDPKPISPARRQDPGATSSCT